MAKQTSVGSRFRPLGRVVSLVPTSPSPDTLSSPPMSSPPPSPSLSASSTLPQSSPPFTPVRNASRKLPPASLPRDASSRPALALVTPNHTPLGPANRFGVLASSNRAPRLDPKTPVNKPRVSLSASNSPVEENWRSTRKRDLPPTPTGATGECRVRGLYTHTSSPIPSRLAPCTFPLYSTPGEELTNSECFTTLCKSESSRTSH